MQKKTIKSKIFNTKNNGFINSSSNYFYIRTKNNSLQPFIANKEQLYMLNIINNQYKENNYNKILVLKSRQIGSTTLFCALGFYYTMVNKGFKTFVLSHRQSSTNNLFDIVTRFYNNLPLEYKQKILSSRYKNIYFEQNDSWYNFATAGSKEVARGDTVQFLHGSEVAFWPNSGNHMASIFSTVPDKNSFVFLESTSAGPKGAFYDICMDSIKHKNNYKLIFLPWFWHADYTVNSLTFNDINENTIPKAWLEYKEAYNLSINQTIWAYKQNNLISLHNGNNGPSDMFSKEFPATIEEAFKFNNNNNLINLNTLQSRGLNNEFTNKLHNKDLFNLFLEQKKTNPIILGVDMAYGGEDSTYIIDRMGSFIGFNVNLKLNTKNTMHIVGLIKHYTTLFNSKDIFIDVAGGGVGVCDRLLEIGIFANKIHFASVSSNKSKFANIRAQMWYKIKEFLDNDGYIIEDNWIFHQLSNVSYFYNSNGQMQLQSKEEIKKQLKYSPDAGDAIALTFAKDILTTLKINTTYNNNLYNYNPLEY